MSDGKPNLATVRCHCADKGVKESDVEKLFEGEVTSKSFLSQLFLGNFEGSIQAKINSEVTILTC